MGFIGFHIHVNDILNKIIEESIRQDKLQSQAAEQSYRALMEQDNKIKFQWRNAQWKTSTDAPDSLTSEMISQYKREEERNFYPDVGASKAKV